jgi:hypothetical protein
VCIIYLLLLHAVVNHLITILTLFAGVGFIITVIIIIIIIAVVVVV